MYDNNNRDQDKDDHYEKLKELKEKGINKKRIINENLYQEGLLLKLRFNPFNENLGDNLLRFFAKQIIDCLETLDRNYLVHFNIKPDNLLMSQNLMIKLSGFSLLTKVNQDQLIIPGGVKGNLTPEYYLKDSMSKEEAKKQDYFSFGSTLYFLIYGKKMFEKYDYFLDSDKQEMNGVKFINTLQNKISKIKSDQFIEKDLIDFMCNLLDYNSEGRENFEHFYRNKWLNKNNKELREIMIINHNDNKKAIIEFQKSDFLIKKEKDLNKHKKKFIFIKRK